jgi:SHS2 domain-containing protein
VDRPSPGFEIIDHTADVGLRGWAPDFPSLCEIMARALFEVIADTAPVKPRTSRELGLGGESREDLLHDWLEALNSEHQIRGEIYSQFMVRVGGGVLAAEVWGEPIDPGRHDLRTEVKAVTWHDLRVTDVPGGLEAYVLLDI